MRLTALFLSVALILIPAQFVSAKVEEPQEAFGSELLIGTIGGAALGFGAAFALGEICLSQTTGLDSIGCIGAFILGYMMGVPTGSIIGVNWAGSQSGVEGNLFLSILGGIGGSALGMLTATTVNAAFEESASEVVSLALFLGVAPFMASLGATWGFNAGAELAPAQESLLGTEQTPSVLHENLLIP